MYVELISDNCFRDLIIINLLNAFSRRRRDVMLVTSVSLINASKIIMFSYTGLYAIACTK